MDRHPYRPERQRSHRSHPRQFHARHPRRPQSHTLAIPTDEAATTALANPSLTFKIVEKATNDMGDFSGLLTREVQLAPGSTGPNPGFYYGRSTADPHPFLLDRDTYSKLAIDILETE